MKNIHIVSIVGLGAIGSYFAEKIQPVLKDNLRIIAGGRRKEQLEKEGRIINGHQRFFHLVSPEENTGYSDLVLICSKMTGLKQALKDAGNQIGPETIILTPLNGVESEEVAASMYGRDQVLYSLMRVSSVKSGNQITFDPEVSYIEFGEQINDPNALSPKVQKVKEFFDLAAIPSVIRPDMLRAIWEKYVCNVSENQVSAVLNIPFGAWGACTDADRLRLLTAKEVIQIARKKGIPIEENYAEKHLDRLKKLPPGNTPSTLQDLLAGRKTEVEMFAGTILRMGKELDIPTPFNEFLYHAIRVLEAKNEGKIPGSRGGAFS